MRSNPRVSRREALKRAGAAAVLAAGRRWPAPTAGSGRAAGRQRAGPAGRDRLRRDGHAAPRGACGQPQLRGRGGLRLLPAAVRERHRGGEEVLGEGPRGLPGLSPRARPAGHRRDLRADARPLASADGHPRLPGGQGRLRGEARLADGGRGPRHGRRGAEVRQDRPARHAAAVDDHLPGGDQARPLRQARPDHVGDLLDRRQRPARGHESGARPRRARLGDVAGSRPLGALLAGTPVRVHGLPRLRPRRRADQLGRAPHGHRPLGHPPGSAPERAGRGRELPRQRGVRELRERRRPLGIPRLHRDLGAAAPERVPGAHLRHQVPGDRGRSSWSTATRSRSCPRAWASRGTSASPSGAGPTRRTTTTSSTA